MYPTLDIRIGGLYSDNYVKALQSFKISLCFLRKMNFDQQTTRSVEIPACGGFLMAERTSEHLSLFEENKEAVYFSSNKELLEKCKFYLKNDPERKQIIENGHKRCIQSGYSNIDTIYKILKNMYINNANYFDTIKNFIRKILAIISIIHLSVFFNIETILGISVTWISTELYLRFILKRSNVILRPFSFIAISFLFLFMYFAPIVTLIDFNPIYNNMHLPLITFPLQLIYFSILILSFCLFNNYQNNKLTGIWKSFGFFNSISNKHLWLLAIGAWAIRLYLITNRYGEDGTNEIAGAGTLSFFATFIYAPLIIPFKNLYDIKSKYKTPQFDTPIILYIIATTLVNITSNSRNAIISIFIVLAIYFFLFL